MTISDCLAARSHSRFANTLDVDAPAKRSDVLEPHASARLLSIADLLRVRCDTIDVDGATYDVAA